MPIQGAKHNTEIAHGRVYDIFYTSYSMILHRNSVNLGQTNKTFALGSENSKENYLGMPQEVWHIRDLCIIKPGKKIIEGIATTLWLSL